MALFGDRRKRLNDEVVKLNVALQTIALGLAPSTEQAQAGVDLGTQNITTYMKALRAKGKAAEADVALDKLTSNHAPIEAFAAGIRGRIRAALGGDVPTT